MTRLFATDWWSIEVPSDWQVEPGEPISIFRNQGVGALQITATLADKTLTEKDLLEFASTNHRNVLIADFVGKTSATKEGNSTIQKWWLANGRLMVFATYSSLSKDILSEYSAVDQILSSLRSKLSPAG